MMVSLLIHHIISCLYLFIVVITNPPKCSTHKNEDAQINLEHPLVRFVLLGMRLSHTRKFLLYDFDYRDNQPCNVFVALGA